MVIKFKCPSGRIRRVGVWDNGGKTVDRYTVVSGRSAYGMSDKPQHPQGFNQYIGEVGMEITIG